MSAKETALAKVQDLYLIQCELWNFLDAEQVDAERMKTAEKMLRDFRRLLKEVDWHYMGGEDVLQSMSWIPQEVSQKLKRAPVRSAPAKVAVRADKKEESKKTKPAVRRLKN
ncbi:hypothetical protein FJZ28_00950 [Candidatus Peregrinibacteria bacterium]|nr:hypothetical protein [Candidatus Peregrinibacteria bacterium]